MRHYYIQFYIQHLPIHVSIIVYSHAASPAPVWLISCFVFVSRIVPFNIVAVEEAQCHIQSAASQFPWCVARPGFCCIWWNLSRVCDSCLRDSPTSHCCWLATISVREANHIQSFALQLARAQPHGEYSVSGRSILRAFQWSTSWASVCCSMWPVPSTTRILAVRMP